MFLRWLFINYLIGGPDGVWRFLRALCWMALIVVGFVVLVLISQTGI